MNEGIAAMCQTKTLSDCRRTLCIILVLLCTHTVTMDRKIICDYRTWLVFCTESNVRREGEERSRRLEQNPTGFVGRKSTGRKTSPHNVGFVEHER